MIQVRSKSTNMNKMNAEFHSHSTKLTKKAFINHRLHHIHGVSIQIHEDTILSIMSVDIKYEITQQANSVCVVYGLQCFVETSEWHTEQHGDILFVRYLVTLSLRHTAVLDYHVWCFHGNTTPTVTFLVSGVGLHHISCTFEFLCDLSARKQNVI